MILAYCDLENLIKDGSEAREDSAFYALMFLAAGVVMGGAVFFQVCKMIGPWLREHGSMRQMQT